MKILHVTTVPQTLRFFSGQIRYLRQAGLEIEAISTPGPVLDRFGAQHEIPTWGVVMLRRISPFADLVAVLRIWRQIRRSRPDVVQASTPKAGLLGTIAARLAGVPVTIFHIHGMPHLAAKGLRRILLILATRVSAALADRVYCVSHSLASIVAVGLCDRRKIVVFQQGSSGGVDAAGTFHPGRFPAEARAELRSRYGLPLGRTVVGFVGRIVPDKGIVELLDAWQALAPRFPTAHLAIAGSFEKEYPVAPEVARRLREDPRITLCDWIDDMPGFYSALDLLVLPSYREGFPNAVLEAGAMELPAIATDVPGCADSVIDGVTGTLIPARSAAAVEGALARYLADPDLRRRHGEAARERMLRDFRPDAIWRENHLNYVELRTRHGGGEPFSRRCFDFAAAACGLVLAAPLILLAGLAIRLTMGGPVLFRQRRAGRGEREFTILKFRTMLDLRDASGRWLPDERRLTPLGRLLRATSIDELPQLLNVLRGEMSLVGPRPLPSEYLPRYSAEQRRRHEVRPGITGWAQVNGRNDVTWERRLAMDVWYVEHASPWLDLHILGMTMARVAARSGISRQGHATMPEFQGAGAGHEP